MNIEIANRLVQLRKQHGYSQEELAAKLGLSRQAVSKWERAEASPDTDNLIMLSRVYGVSLDELLKTDEPIPAPAPVCAVYGLYHGIVYGYGQKQYPARVPKAPYAAHAKEGYGDQ